MKERKSDNEPALSLTDSNRAVGGKVSGEFTPHPNVSDYQNVGPAYYLHVYINNRK
jgi:hypothetical protein